MAQSPSHKFGQIIGNLLESVMYPLLLKYCHRNNLYLDKVGLRPARQGKKVSWTDRYGNSHDLDFVIEKNGTQKKRGRPVAFIESAWRRYTKHSRNKAQEIQGAILPLAETYSDCSPFLGAVLAGVFTDGALNQLKSHGFSVLYFEYDKILKAFSNVGIDIFFDEKTPLNVFAKKIKSLDKLSKSQYNKIVQNLINRNKKGIDDFFKQLSASILREVISVRIFNLYGRSNDYRAIKDAIKAIKLSRTPGKIKFIKFEIIIKFNNGDRVDGQFSAEEEALRFLHFFSSDHN